MTSLFLMLLLGFLSFHPYPVLVLRCCLSTSQLAVDVCLDNCIVLVVVDVE